MSVWDLRPSYILFCSKYFFILFCKVAKNENISNCGALSAQTMQLFHCDHFVCSILYFWNIIIYEWGLKACIRTICFPQCVLGAKSFTYWFFFPDCMKRSFQISTLRWIECWVLSVEYRHFIHISFLNLFVLLFSCFIFEIQYELQIPKYKI